MKVNKRNTLIFIIVTLASGWIGVLIDNILTDQQEGNTLGMLMWLILPFLTSIILRIISHDRKDIGIKPNFRRNFKWYLIAIGIYPFVTVILVGIALIFGSVEHFDFNLKSFISFALFSTMASIPKNIFEEFAWRGYLTPKLIDLGIDSWLLYLISGLVWSLWHSAYYLVFLPDSYFTSTSRISTLLFGCMVMVCWTVMYVEIYRLTKSVWPCVLMHMVGNSFPTVLVATDGFISFTNNSDIWLNPNNGIIAIILYLFIGILLRKYRLQRDVGGK